ncbi:MAG: Hsp70 family protein, partial [Hyphomonadaceae bacterium]|nr:Hsp70 family protein [Clostridia bacterium]
VSILELFEGVMEVKSIAGDNYLGGEDFTALLANYFMDTHNIAVHDIDNKALAIIQKQAEQCKFELGINTTAKMCFSKGEQLCETVLDRDSFEKLVYPLLTRLRHPIERALRDASLTPHELDAVILIGGATRMNVVRAAVSKMFNRLPYSNINPDEAVALGAAIQVALKERNAALDEVILTDVCPYTLGVDIAQHMGNGKYEDGYFLPIIERNSTIPISRVEKLNTIQDNQTKIQLDIYQGESRRVENNIKLGSLNVSIPASRAGEQQIEVRYTYDINGILEVEVVHVQSGKKHRLVIENSPGSMTQKEIDVRLKALDSIKIHPRDRTENKHLLARGERMYEESLGDTRDFIMHILQKFESVLATQNDREIKKARAELNESLDTIERRFEF